MNKAMLVNVLAVVLFTNFVNSQSISFDNLIFNITQYQFRFFSIDTLNTEEVPVGFDAHRIKKFEE